MLIMPSDRASNTTGYEKFGMLSTRLYFFFFFQAVFLLNAGWCFYLD